jgi:hypothetical protein
MKFLGFKWTPLEVRGKKENYKEFGFLGVALKPTRKALIQLAGWLHKYPK